MTPERIAELRAMQSKGPVPVLCGQDLADLLDTADREAKLRKASEVVLNWLPILCGPSRLRDSVEGLLRSALESKGGES